MSQCVPSWDLDETTYLPLTSTPHVPSLDYEVAELTWENGQLAMHGLGPPRSSFLPPLKNTSPRPGTGTLESLVNQATTTTTTTTTNTNAYHVPQIKNVNNTHIVPPPWFDQSRNNAAVGVTHVDALVPCSNNNHREGNSRHHVHASGGGICSCNNNDDNNNNNNNNNNNKTNVSVSESTATRNDWRQVMNNDTRELGDGGFVSTSLWSPQNTSSGKDDHEEEEEDEYTMKTMSPNDDYDSVCHSRSQKEGRSREDEEGEGQEVKKKNGNGNGKSSSSSILTKRSRAAAIHNQSERKRRDRINQRMKTLQKLVPNSSKTDKASILDEVIEHLKQLQAQVQMMSRMNIPQMMLPLALQHQQQLQMSMMGMGMGMCMGVGMGMGVMDFNSLGRAAGMQPIIPPPASGMPSVMPQPAAFMPMGSWDMQGDRAASAPAMPDLLSTFLACQSQPTTMEAYSRLAALYQQLQQGSGLGSGLGSSSGPKN